VFRAALEAADPGQAVKRHVAVKGGVLRAGGTSYDLSCFSRMIVVGAGKASCPLAAVLEEILRGRISSGLVITKYGHGVPLKTVEVVEAGHPIPDAAGMAATQRILALAGAADGRTLLIDLLSGGGSALLVAPAAGLTLADKQQVTDRLLRAGATISELNSVRKHLSRVKGGRLAEAAGPATVLSLILSDVIADRLDVIASGPFAPDSTTFADALAVLDRYGLRASVPAATKVLEDGAAGRRPETPKQGASCFAKVQNVIVGSLNRSLQAASDKARSLGYEAEITTAELQGEASQAASMLARRARDAAARGGRRCLISGGETTVTVRGSGRGGRNQELALAFALEIEGEEHIALLSAGTDGTDGPTDAAGAVVDGATVRRAREAGLDPGAFLRNNDSCTFFEQLDALTHGRSHLKTGPTGTNVMDIQAIIINAHS
jgi:hydroxypyruvate reductase